MNTAIRVHTTIVLVLLPTVMFGGFSLLRLLGAGRLNEFQRSMFRAGHAHAGVLLILSMTVFGIMDRFGISVGWCWLIGTALIVGVLAQSGGMFVHMAIGKPAGGWTKGNTLTTTGAIILALSLFVTAFLVATA